MSCPADPYYLACTESAWNVPIPVTNLGDYGGHTTIASPNYPSLYTDSSECSWNVQASDPNNLIQIKVIDWDVSIYALNALHKHIEHEYLFNISVVPIFYAK